MTTKQVQSFDEYFEKLEYAKYKEGTVSIDSYMLVYDGESGNKKTRKTLVGDFLTNFIDFSYVNKYEETDEATDSTYTEAYVDSIRGDKGSWVSFPKGIVFSRTDPENSCVCYGEIIPSDFGYDSSRKFKGVMCGGALAASNIISGESFFDCVYSISGVMGSLEVEECHFKEIGNYEDDGDSHITIFSKLSLRKSCGITWEGHESSNTVFNTNGGATDVYSQTEIDTKLQPLTQLESYFKGSLGDFNSTSDFRSALNNMIKDKKEAGRYVATLYGSLIIVTFALLDKSSGTYSQWVEGSIIKGSDGELYLNNELGYRICGRVGLGTTWGVWRANVLDDELPIAATKSHDGLMSKEDKTAFESMKTTIESLEARIAALEAK